MNKKELENWLNKRIEQTHIEKENENSLERIISKGSKLTVYKEILNYIKQHENI